MAVTDEQALKLFNDIKDVCLDIIKDAHEFIKTHDLEKNTYYTCLLYTSPSPRDPKTSRMPSSA